MGLLLVFLLLYYLPSHASQVRPIQVYGLITQSVSLSPTKHLAHPVEEVLWHYISNGTRHRLADFRNQQLSIRHSQFSHRLEADNNGTRLWIRELRSEDTGSYIAFITLQGTTQTIDLTFNLTVYEPVPSPDIKMEMEQNTSDWCNFTLLCSGPTNPSALSYSWMYRHKEQYQPYTNGTTIRVSLQPESWDGEYLCFIHNPADHKNVSITPREFCPDIRRTKVINDSRKHYILLIILLLALLLLSIAWYVRAMKKRKKGPPSTVIDPLNEVQYIEIHTCQSDKNLKTIYSLEQKPASPRETRAQTIYTELQNVHRTSQE
ncbi:SLAM family member 5 [Xenopus laevis]|uniref:SLAM family member 5 n=1 Tax=Xenopus laevis TaxID=8355 RepID=A0A8J0U710_XENLA|nr:SLAM family member 5 [Xenopus laevis]